MTHISNKDTLTYLKGEIQRQPGFEDVYEAYFNDGLRNKPTMAQKILENLEPEEILDEFPELNTVQICDACGKLMVEGYCINGGDKYFCCDKCLHTALTDEQYEKLYNDGSGDTYYTNWVEENEE